MNKQLFVKKPFPPLYFCKLKNILLKALQFKLQLNFETLNKPNPTVTE